MYKVFIQEIQRLNTPSQQIQIIPFTMTKIERVRDEKRAKDKPKRRQVGEERRNTLGGWRGLNGGGRRGRGGYGAECGDLVISALNL